MTTYGVIGVKVWIFKGEVFEKTALEKQAAEGDAPAGQQQQPPAAAAPAEAPAQA
jgi:ribosomal protein S3